MSKFEPLTSFLRSLPNDERRMTFGEVERVLGFALPPSARRHRPWWSNNPHNSAMTRAWLVAGFHTEQVDMAGETLVFRKGPPRSGSSGVPVRSEAKPGLGSPIGGLRGSVRTAEGFDLILPTGEVWDAEAGR